MYSAAVDKPVCLADQIQLMPLKEISSRLEVVKCFIYTGIPHFEHLIILGLVGMPEAQKIIGPTKQ